MTYPVLKTSVQSNVFMNVISNSLLENKEKTQQRSLQTDIW